MKKIVLLAVLLFSGSLFANEYLGKYMSLFFNAKINKDVKNIECRNDYTCVINVKDENTTMDLHVYFEKNVVKILNEKDFKTYEKYKKTQDVKINEFEKKLAKNLKQIEIKNLNFPTVDLSKFEVKDVLVDFNKNKYDDNDSFTYMIKNIKSVQFQKLKAVEDGKDFFLADLVKVSLSLPKVITGNLQVATLDDLLGNVKIDVKNMRYSNEAQSSVGMIMQDINESSQEDKDDFVSMAEKNIFFGQNKTNITEILSGLNFLRDLEEGYLAKVGNINGSLVIKSVKSQKDLKLEMVYNSIDDLINQDLYLAFRLGEPVQMYNGIRQNPQMVTMFLMQGAYYLDELKFSASGYKKLQELINKIIKANQKDYGTYSMFFEKIASSMKKVTLIDGKAYLSEKEIKKAKSMVDYFQKNADLANYDMKNKYFLTLKNDKNITLNNSMMEIVKTMQVNKMMADSNATKIEDASRDGFAFVKNIIDVILYFEENYKINY